LIGAFDPRSHNGYYRKLASNLRGRLLQLMPESTTAVENLTADDAVLYALVGRTGLYCGLQSPREANGFHPGGTRFFHAEVSRAGAKIASALHHLRLHMPALSENSHWLELGASPGGMTSELLRHGHRVTAIDRAALDPSLAAALGLRFHRADVATWKPAAGTTFDALLCDMNGPADAAFAQVVRLARHLRPGAPIVFTLKTTGAESFSAILALHRHLLTTASAAGLTHLQTTHLAYNRREFTVFLRKH
jgi:23S rRNA C2498 (ribose-2'-O)-methylase RlmM